MARRGPEETVESTYAAVAPSRLWLVVARPAGVTLRVALPARGRVSVGRDEQADLRVASESLSRLHFAIEVEGDALAVRDVGSRNGTLVDGVPIGDVAVPLALGSEILAGDVRFAIVRRTDAARAADEELEGVEVQTRGDPPSAAAEEAIEDPGGGADVPSAFRHRSLRSLHADLRRVAPRTISILVTGETGTGKELVAREIHRLSRRSGALVAVNAAALPETLIESELFGHERGAFSGAVTAKVGLIEASDGGTLFLDEIGELPLAMQAKLLRVLEERTVRRVGATAERKVDLRVVTATHQDLAALARERRFRNDLLFRLNGATIELPPLRARAGEVVELARQILAELTGGTPPAIDTAAARALAAYGWPGNVRELKQVLDRALAFVDGEVLGTEHLPRALVDASGAAPPPAAAALASSAAPSAPSAAPGAGDVRASVRDFERDRIRAALKESGGNRTRAAELLGLPRRTLVYKLSKMRIDES